MTPNALYYLSVIPLSIGIFMVYKAGRADAIREMKAEEAKKWEDAARDADDDRTESKTDEYRTLSRIMPSDQAESITKYGWGDYA